jgi:uncharacterized protein
MSESSPQSNPPQIKVNLKWFLWLTLLSALIPGSFLSHISVENSLDLWIDFESPDYQNYKRFTDTHGTDEWVFVIVNPENQEAISPETIQEFESDLNQIQNVESVTRMDQPLLLWDLPAGQKQAVLSSPEWAVFKKSLSRPGAAWNIESTPSLTAKQRSTLINEIKRDLADRFPDVQPRLGGPTIFSAELDRISGEEGQTLFPIALTLAGIIVFGYYRSIRNTLALFICGASTLVWTFGVIVWTHNDLNLVTLALPALVGTIALAGGAHVVHLSNKSPELSWSDRYRLSLQQLAKPMTVAHLTTACGFLALTWSHLIPVRQMGWMAAVGVSFSWFFNLFVLTGLTTAKAYSDEKAEPNHRPSSISEGFQNSQKKFALEWVTLFGVCIVSVLALIPTLKTETDVLRFFHDEARIVSDYHWIESNWTSLTPIEWDVEGEAEKVQAWCSQLLEDWKSDERISSAQFTSKESSVNRYRLTLLAPWMQNEMFNQLTADLEDWNQKKPQPGADARLTGSIPLINRAQAELIRTQIWSIALAAVLIAVILLVTLKSFRLLLIGILVNLAPVAFLFGVMALLNIPLNTATVMVSSIILGIAVDDTVFFLSRYLKNRSDNLKSDPSVSQQNVWTTWNEVLAPVTLTTVVTSVGFSVLIFSNFEPMSYFGLLGAIGMMLAWIADMVLLPILLILFGPDGDIRVALPANQISNNQ